MYFLSNPQMHSQVGRHQYLRQKRFPPGGEGLPSSLPLIVPSCHTAIGSCVHFERLLALKCVTHNATYVAPLLLSVFLLSFAVPR